MEIFRSYLNKDVNLLRLFGYELCMYNCPPPCSYGHGVLTLHILQAKR